MKKENIKILFEEAQKLIKLMNNISDETNHDTYYELNAYAKRN